METKIFVLDEFRGDLVQKPESGSGNLVKFDELREEGWRPLHWTDISEERVIRYRVIMERDEKSKADFGFGSASQ